MKLFFCVVVCIFNISLAINLPNYMPRCFLWNDEGLGECIADKANYVLQSLLQGDKELCLESMSPLHFSEVKLEGKNLLISAKDTYFHGLRNIIITKAMYDVKGHCEAYSTLDVIAAKGTYTIKKGKILSQQVSGSGKFIMTFVTNNMDCKFDFIVIEQKNEHHMKFTNITVDNFTSNRIYFHFENLQSPEKEDMNTFINQNWRIVRDEIKPSLMKYVNQFCSLPSIAVAKYVPLERIFQF